MTQELTDMIQQSGLAPLYGTITMTRVNTRLIVTCAPTVGLIAPEVLFDLRSFIRVIGHTVEILDQVTYRITGWDRNEQALIVLLEEDHR